MAGDEVIYRIAETREDIEGAVRLVYRNYVELGYCRLNRFGVHFYLYDVLPETRTLVALRGGAVVATLTLVFDSPLGVPSNKLYRQELDALRSGGRKVVEISKLSVDRSLGARGLAVLKGLFRLAWLTSCRVRGSSDFVIMIEPHHEGFYTRALLFEKVGDLKPDPEAKDAPSLLLRLDLLNGPEKFLAAFGETPRDANPWWFFVGSPEVDRVEAEAQAADARLSEMNRRVETGAKLADPTPAERSYIDYRLFSIAFVTDKTCKEAELRSRRALFADEIAVYDRLLAALPPDYAPERRARIYIDIAKAAWHCAMHERAGALARAAQALAVGPDLKAAGTCILATALHFQGRGDEAQAELRQGLSLPGLSALDRGRMLQIDGRLAIERFELKTARRQLAEAIDAGKKVPPGHDAAQLLARTYHNQWILEIKDGDLLAAREALRAGAAQLGLVDRTLLMQYSQAWCRTEMSSGRMRDALAHAEMGLRHIATASDPFNSAVMTHARCEAQLALGMLEAAGETNLREIEFAAQSHFQTVIIDALCQRVTLLSANDRLAEARSELEAGLAPYKEPASRVVITVLQARAGMSALEHDWGSARRLLAAAEQQAAGIPEFLATARYERVRLELVAGDIAAARELAACLVGPEKLRGFVVYEALWNNLQAVLAAADGDEDRALALAQAAMNTYRSGEAAYNLATDAVSMAEALAACRLSTKCPRLFEYCKQQAAEACKQVRLPLVARQLAELG